MEIITDLHLHSKYSRAVSQQMTLSVMTHFAKKKGLGLLTTGDWTHPLWLREIKQNLEEDEKGIYRLKSGSKDDPKFILSVEVSSIYSQGGKTRRIHNLLFAPSIEVAEKFNKELVKRGVNITSDGRPIMGLRPPELLEILMAIDDRSFLIPCHVWTPWFSLYGSMSGFDSIEECFGSYSKYIYGVETGLSSDPCMNWRIDELKNRSILSNSDSHSPIKMGREATIFVPKDSNKQISKYANKQITFEDIRLAIMKDPKAKYKIGYTLEFYPEEGKYHYTGHRNCKVSYSPDEMRKKGVMCPVCGKNLTVGVMQRVEDLATKSEKTKERIGESGVKWITDPEHNFPPYAKLVPLNEIIAETLGVGVASVKVKSIYEELTQNLGSEFDILLKIPVSEISKSGGESLAQAIMKVRTGDIYIDPGFDGEYGVVKIESEKKIIEKEILKQEELL